MKKKISKYYFVIIILIIIVVYIIYFNNKTYKNLENNTEVSIITLDEYRAYKENYNNNSTDVYFQDEYMKIKHTETLNGIVYNYGIIFPYYIWQSGEYNEIQKYAIYFVEDYSFMFNKYDLSVAVGVVNIEPNTVFMVRLLIQSRNLNEIINPKGINNSDHFSFRFTEDMVDMLLKKIT